MNPDNRSTNPSVRAQEIPGEYLEKIEKILEESFETNEEKIRELARKVAEKISNDSIIYIFGCGHSQLPAQEVFYRAGGLAPIEPMIDEGLSLKGATRASTLERLECYARTILEKYDPSEDDLIIIISVSGRNPVPIEMALEAKNRGLETVAITSKEKYGDVGTPRHKTGELLRDIADVVIDDRVPYGDAVLEIEGIPQKVGPVSGAVNSSILHATFSMAAAILGEEGKGVPVFRSGNIEGGNESNKKYIEKYKNRLKNL